MNSMQECKRKRAAAKRRNGCAALVVCICLLLSSCALQRNTGNGNQKITGCFQGGILRMVVETDKTIYSYDDIVYVTVTLINESTEKITVLTPTSKRGIHQELTTELRNDSGEPLIDMDIHVVDFFEDGGSFSLAPGEKYVQSMRFSARVYRNQHAERVVTEAVPKAGTFHGEATAHVIYQDEEALFTVPFAVTLEAPPAD